MSSRTLLRLAAAGRWSLALLAFCLPFEAVLFDIGPLQVTNLEALLALVVLVTVALVIGERRWREAGWLRFPRAWLLLWALIVLALAASTLLAPEHRLNAAKASARMIAGMALALCAPQLLRRPNGARADEPDDGRRHPALWIALPLLLGGAPAALAGLWEVWRRTALPWLAPFRDVPTFVGPFIRFTSSFDHANQAAMFFEATLPFVLALALIAAGKRRRWLYSGALLALLLWLQAIISTYSRTAVVAAVAAALLVAALLISRRLLPGNGSDSSPQRRKGLFSRQFMSKSRPTQSPISQSPISNLQSPIPWAAIAIALILLTLLNALVDPVVRMRMRTEGDNEWYNLQFDVPDALQIDAGHTLTTTVTVHNQGELLWASSPPHSIYLGGHWLLPGEEISLAYRPRWPLPRPVAPGESITLRVGLHAPLQAGRYQFRWDMLHEGSTWFSYKNGVRTRTDVVVREGPPPPAPASPEEEAALTELVEAPPDLAPIPARRELWRIAAQEFLQRPLTGIGLDNFRLVYGRALDYEQFNETIHTNNWAIEILVSLGLLGALPTFAWLALLLLILIRALRRTTVTVWHAALAASLFAFLLHGLLDYFLAANATGLLFWMVNGLWVVVESER